MKEKIRVGFIEPTITEDNYVLGAKQVPEEVLQLDGQWLDYSVEKERQEQHGLETYNCTGFATSSPVEIYIKRKYGVEVNLSDRALGILAGTYPPGNNPHIVAESLRKHGNVKEESLPFSDSLKNVDDYYSPNPLPKKLLQEAEQFLYKYDFLHEWVFNDKGLDIKEKQEKMKKALTLSPLGASVMAWRKRGDLYVKDKGEPDTHWTTVVGYKEDEYWLVFDSYNPFLKKLAWDYDFGYVKRYWVGESTKDQKDKQIAVIIKLFLMGQASYAWEILKAMAGLGTKQDKPVQQVEIPKEEPSPKKDYITLFAKSIQEFEGWHEGSKSFRNNNPGNLKSVSGKFIKFESYEDGFAYLKDYIYRASTGKHKAYNPEMTIFKFVEVYAPPSENSGASILNYAKHIAKGLGISPETKLKELV